MTVNVLRIMNPLFNCTAVRQPLTRICCVPHIPAHAIACTGAYMHDEAGGGAARWACKATRRPSSWLRCCPTAGTNSYPALAAARSASEPPPPLLRTEAVGAW